MSAAGSGQRASSGWSLANSLAAMTASFAGFVLVANLVGTDQLGLLALAGAALFPLRFAELGLSGAVTRYVGAQRGPGRRRYVWQVVGLGWGISLATFSLLLGVCAVIAPPLLRGTIAAELQDQAWRLVPLLALSTLLQLVAGTLLSGLLGLQRFRLVYAAGTVVALGQLAAIYPLVLTFGVAGMVIAQIASQATLGLIFLAALLRLPRDHTGEITELDRPAFLRFTFQFSVNSMLATLLEPVAKLTIGAHAPLSVMGLFEVMWRILMQLRTLLVAPLNPLGIAMIAQWQTGREAVAPSYRMMAAYSLAAGLALLIVAPPAHLAFGLVTPASAPADPLVTASIALALALAFQTVPSYFLALAANEVRPIIGATLSTLVVQLTAGSLLGHLFGWQAVFAAFVSGFAVAAAVQLALITQILRYPAVPGLADMREGMRGLRSLLKGNAASEQDSSEAEA